MITHDCLLLIRVRLCDLMDRSVLSAKADDPRNHTDGHERGASIRLLHVIDRVQLNKMHQDKKCRDSSVAAFWISGLVVD